MIQGRRRLIIWATAAAGTAVLLYFVPLFHVVPLNQTGQHAAGSVFDARTFVDEFWSERLIPSAAQAEDAAQLTAALQQDRQAARKKQARSVGEGGAYYYFVAGTGRVVSVDMDSVGLSLHDGQTAVQVSLTTGYIFGNAVRDGTGLLNVNDFPNSQDFNALSAEINRRIELEVLPPLRKKAVVGTAVRFVGCAAIMDEDTDLHPLRVVPFLVEVKPP